jgi:hypothetical protein
MNRRTIFMKKIISLLITLSVMGMLAAPAFADTVNNYYGDVYYGDVYFGGDVKDYGYSYNNKGYVELSQIDWQILAGTYSKRTNAQYNSTNMWVWTNVVNESLTEYTAYFNNKELKASKYGSYLVMKDGSRRSGYCTDAGFSYNCALMIQEGENLVMYPYGYVSGSYCYIAANVKVESLYRDENGVVIGVNPVKTQQDWQQNNNWGGYPNFNQGGQNPPPGQSNGQYYPNNQQNQYPAYGVNMRDIEWFVGTGSTTMHLTYSNGLLKENNSGNVITYMSKGLAKYTAVNQGYVWAILTNNTIIKAHPYGSTQVIYPKGDPYYFTYDANGFGVSLVTSKGTYEIANLQNQSSSGGNWNTDIDYTGNVINYNDSTMAVYFENQSKPNTLAISGTKLTYNGETLASNCSSTYSKCGFIDEKYVIYIDSSRYAYKVRISTGTKTKISNSKIKDFEYDKNGFVNEVITTSNSYVDVD